MSLDQIDEPTGAEPPEFDAEAARRLDDLVTAVAQPRLRRRPPVTPADRFARRPPRQER